MKLDIQITGLKEIQAQLGTGAKQATYAASRALTTSAYAVNDRLKQDMAATFKGGATPTPCAPSRSSRPKKPP